MPNFEAQPKPANEKNERDEANFIDLAEGKYSMEHDVSPEALEANVGRLEANMKKIGQIPEAVLQSEEGQEATRFFSGRISGKLEGFSRSIMNKLATLDSWKGKDRMAKVLSGVAGAAILGPLVIQMARTKWPEVGMALDAAPDALQQIIHLDVWARIADAFGDGNMLVDGSVWKNGGMEVNNILADISSGKETVSALTAGKLQILADSMNAEDFRVLTSPRLKDSSGYAAALSGGTTAARTVFGNGSLIGIAGFGMYGVMSKIGGLANRFKNNISKH